MGAGWQVSELQSEHLGILLPSLLPDFCPVLHSGCHTRYSLNNSWASGTGKGPSSCLQRGPDQRYQSTHCGQELSAPRAPSCWRALPTPRQLLLPLRWLSILFLAPPSWFLNAVHLVADFLCACFLVSSVSLLSHSGVLVQATVLVFLCSPGGGLPILRTWIVTFVASCL